jgi:DUF971 family protein
MAAPTEIALETPDCLKIVWDDGVTLRYPVRALRDRCPCATCREKKKAPAPPPTQLTVLSPAETLPLRITKMQPIGRYAYAIHFSDGHNTGLYTLDQLREIGVSGDEPRAQG